MPHHLYQFGPYHFHPETRVLTRAGEAVALTPKAAEILLMLVMNAGQVVERDRLLRQVWPDTFVEESNLSQNIFVLRQALGDDNADRRYIETVVRRGYRFIAHVKVVEAEEKPAADLSPTADASIAQLAVVAVLPFLNATGDSGWEYLADGLTDNLINNLSRVTRLRVMSHSAVYRYKTHDVDPQQAGKELGATAVLVGKLNSRPVGVGIGVELVETSTGWQLWGESFDSERKDILEIQDAITRQLLATLKLKLTGEEEKRVTARYTENAEAYQSYLEGRYHWSRYTRKGIEKAIGHFRRAIELDANYALAYAAIVDCYLRLATNYLPPEDDLPRSIRTNDPRLDTQLEPDSRIKLRFEWDWKGAERELRRANDLKTEYPAAHQWYAAYFASRQLYQEAKLSARIKQHPRKPLKPHSRDVLPIQIPSTDLTPSEKVQIYCAVVREQIDAGNYDSACLMLRPWWVFGDWPTLDGLNQKSCADLLFTVGELAGWLASTKQIWKGQKHGEELLNGSIALFEQLGFGRRAAEGRIELALSYYRQGLFDIARTTFVRVLDHLSDENSDLRSLALIRLAAVERHAGRLKDALARLNEATAIVEWSGPWATARCHLELASTHKDLAISEGALDSFDNAKRFYYKALYQCVAVGNHRLAAIVENNLGCLMLSLKDFSQAQSHLLRARRAFDAFEDRIRCAQVDDSLAQLYFAQSDLETASVAIDRALLVMETGDEDALFAEALRTKGMIYCRLNRYREARRILDEAHRLAWRCGDVEGAGRALIILIEEMAQMLDLDERNSIATRLKGLLITSDQLSIRRRAQKCLEILTNG